MKVCDTCQTNKAFIKRPKTSKPICQPCFFTVFEDEIHHTITNNNLFRKGDRVAIGTSGGKDSTVIAHVMNKLNKQYGYGL
jgi:cytoplasmic tRNA 2-thiolation protein 1